MRKYIKQVVFTLFIVVFVSGCSTKGVEFKPDYNSINEIKDNNLQTVSVNHGVFNASQKNHVSLGRGSNKMLSPYGGSFQRYLEISLEEELKQASIYDNQSDMKIEVKLLKNLLDTGMSIGTADLSANFMILSRDKKVFNRTYDVHHEWDSSFVAAIAIPNTVNNYPIAMQKLIDSFLLDKEVIKILKK